MSWAVYATFHVTDAKASAVFSRGFAGTGWHLSETRDTELLHSQLGLVMFEKANKVTRLVSVSRTRAKAHRDGRKRTSINRNHRRYNNRLQYTRGNVL